MDKKSLYKYLLLRSTGDMPKAKTPTIMTRVTKNVYLGNYKNAMEAPYSTINFKYILNLTMEKYSFRDSNINIIHIPLIDDMSTDISKYFDDVTEFLAKCDQRDEPVLVHCIAGVNRSGSMILAYMMSKNKVVSPVLYFLYVYHTLRDLRGAFVENSSFRRQIIEKYITNNY
ncbi:tyr-ser protein phosphatase [Murmansk poxvirus]|uniref:Tyr-ser protein phosphatase n=1 Tax=Murmansk poxvirus TaxID=2025359 RepID=A0A223FMS7_9POXV|nr:tyr-ser protein phosphatase [Murmansk poxvirus]AST09290.1 tyr-ser protein phosphatase [Murmansk poxvirus]